MKNVTREDWIAALENGEYRQGPAFLRRFDKMNEHSDNVCYCCLGILDDIADAWDEQIVLTNNVMRTATIPKQLLDTVGITAVQAESLAGYNDSGFTFPQIAAILRADFTIPFIGKVV